MCEFIKQLQELVCQRIHFNENVGCILYCIFWFYDHNCFIDLAAQIITQNGRLVALKSHYQVNLNFASVHYLILLH